MVMVIYWAYSSLRMKTDILRKARYPKPLKCNAEADPEPRLTEYKNAHKTPLGLGLSLQRKERYRQRERPLASSSHSTNYLRCAPLRGKMPLRTTDATVSDFEEAFGKFKAEKVKVLLLLFLADKDPATSRSWCPDCNVAEPVIYEKLESSESDVALLRAYVGDRPTWRNPSHPWRVDPRFKLTGVPTLIRWENEAIAGRLEDHEAHIADKIDALLTTN